jgi:hypothetical protein
MHSQFFRAAAFSLLSFAVILPASASPWAEVGDNQLRADIELLQAAGVLSTVTIQWPMPWQSLLHDLADADMEAQPATIQAAVGRLLARGQAETAPGVSAWASLDATNQVQLVRGFDGLGRGEGQAQLSLEGTSGPFSGRMSVGAITQNFGGKPNKLMLDGTYLSARLGGVRVYAGYLDHWWGPGQISALQLSNNARPMPQVGISRSSTEASRWPVLKWPLQRGAFDDQSAAGPGARRGQDGGVLRTEPSLFTLARLFHQCGPVQPSRQRQWRGFAGDQI